MKHEKSVVLKIASISLSTFLCMLYLSGCGGGGSSSANSDPSPTPPSVSITISDLAGTYTLYKFTVMSDKGATITEDNVSSYSGRMTISQTGEVSQTVTVEGETVTDASTVRIINDTTLEVTDSQPPCTYNATFSLQGDTLTISVPAGTCGIPYSETDVWKKGSSLSGALSQGPKIFVTDARHLGDFAHDPFLQGKNAIEKADSFCNNDVNRPNGSFYKALIVDGVNRDAVKRVDWVLQANTTYYRPYANVEIGTTTDKAIFAALYANLKNSIHGQINPSSSYYEMLYQNLAWTGFLDAAQYSAGYDCSGWTNIRTSASTGTVYEKNEKAFYNNSIYACASRFRLNCIEQPGLPSPPPPLPWPTPTPGASPLKIFVTAETHVGDFVDDPTLTGSNAIEKVDAFCNKASNKPNDSATYKALIVDSKLRDPSTGLNWVLQPNRTYFRADGITEIGTTDETGLLPCFWIQLTHSIWDCSGSPGCSPLGYFVNPVWVGIQGYNWAPASSGNCNGWSSLQGNGTVGFPAAADYSIVDTYNYYDCGSHLPVYCVQQP